ncbi:O-antigen ligase family protein [Algibacter sp. PT7-4]|uniref:O-antigen ligase family protein n=1 Tax=Algibacter ulvanivorans TaxID=3400999 RepID=UPI003AAB1E90
MKKIIDFCFLYPLVVNALNFQGLAGMFFSNTLGQLLAYGNILFILLGFVLLVKKKAPYTVTGNLWLPYFFIFYIMVSLASVLNDYPFSILASIVPVIFCVGYLSYFRFKENIRKFEIVIMSAFSIANIMLIYFVIINFDYDFYLKGIQLSYGLDRAQGIYGDANNASFVAILGFVFLYKCFNPKNKFQLTLKIALLLMSTYAMFLTYSTTGFVVFMLSFALLNFKYLNKIRLLLLPFCLIGFYLTLINLNSLLDGVDLNPRQLSKIENFVNLLKLDFDNVDSSGRDVFVEQLLEYIYESPFLGNGLDFGAHHHGHNTYLSIFSDSGIFPLILFLILLFKYFINILKIDYNQKFYALAIFFGFCLFMLSLQTIINQAYLLVIFVYLAYFIDFNTPKNTNLA